MEKRIYGSCIQTGYEITTLNIPYYFVILHLFDHSDRSFRLVAVKSRDAFLLLSLKMKTAGLFTCGLFFRFPSYQSSCHHILDKTCNILMVHHHLEIEQHLLPYINILFHSEYNVLLYPL